jgi:hypothetical protein
MPESYTRYQPSTGFPDMYHVMNAVMSENKKSANKGACEKLHSENCFKSFFEYRD